MKHTLDFKTMPSLSDFLRRENDCTYKNTPEGLEFAAFHESRDPYVYFDIVSAAARSGLKKGLCDAGDLAAVTVRLKTNHPGYFEIYYAAGDVTEPTAYANAGDHYEGGQWETVLCDFTERSGYKGALHDGFRIDWSNYCLGGDTMTVSSITLYSSAEEAKICAKQENTGRLPFTPYFDVETGAPETLQTPSFYVCLNEKRLETGENNILGKFEDIGAAKNLCDEKKVYGYRVADETGRVVYSPYTLLQCDILREGKFVTDYARTHSFRYGDAPVNPGINCDAGLVSCDRLVCWVLFRLGFIHQPYAQGVVVSVFPNWCEKNGFIKIEDCTALEPGDVMLVRPHHEGFPQHAFLFAGYSEKPEHEPNFPAHVADPLAPIAPPAPLLYSYRYDCGSDARIQSVQPSKECLFPGAYTPVCLYRPVATPENCVNYRKYCK